MENSELDMISVIMPVYNAENTVEKTISSILAQTLQNFELIIVDDGSTDGTARVCRQFDSDKIVYFRQENAGPAAARNLGLTKARGSLICFADADDTLQEDYLQVLSSCIDGADLAICGYNELKAGNPSDSQVPPKAPASSESQVPPKAPAPSDSQVPPKAPASSESQEISKSGNPSDSKAPPGLSDTSEWKNIPETAERIMKRILHDDTIGGFLWNKIFRKSLIERNGITFSRNIFVGEDLLFVEQYLAACENVHITNKKLYNYFTSPDSISHAMTAKNLTILRALEKIRGLSDEPDFVRTVTIRYVRQFLSFAALFPEKDCPPGRLTSFLKTTDLSRREVFGGLTKNYKLKYALYLANRKLFRKLMSCKKGAEQS